MKYDLSTLEGRDALRKAWVEALRSGKYKQTKEKLRSRNGGMCCLGVLCEVAGLKSHYDEGTYYYTYGDSSTYAEPPQDFSDSFKLRSASGRFGADKAGERMRPEGVLDADSLVAMNDGGKYKFKDIADIIEKYPEIIFEDEVSQEKV